MFKTTPLFLCAVGLQDTCGRGGVEGRVGGGTIETIAGYIIKFHEILEISSEVLAYFRCIDLNLETQSLYVEDEERWLRINLAVRTVYCPRKSVQQCLHT